MKKYILAALLIAAPLGGCESFFRSETVQAAAVLSTSTSVKQAYTLKAAGEFYVSAARLTTTALDEGLVSKENAQRILDINGQLVDALKKGKAAQDAGDSPGIAAAIALFNSNYGALAKLIPGLN